MAQGKTFDLTPGELKHSDELCATCHFTIETIAYYRLDDGEVRVFATFRYCLHCRSLITA